MNRLTIGRKLLIVLITSIAFTILFSFFFIHFLYSKLYLDSIEQSIVYQGKRTASHYHYGELSDEIIEKIQWYNIVSEYEIIVVDRLDDLSSYFPYKIDYENLVGPTDTEILEKGSYVLKKGYVEELDREVLGAIFPIKGENGLIGFIYIYVPLSAIQDVFKESIPLLALVGASFFIILFLLINRALHSLLQPLEELQRLSAEVSKGNYSSRIEIDRSDEIGQLSHAFNKMSLSLEEQEKRKKEFTSNIVHELRTPLTYIGGYTHVLKEKIFDSPEEAQKYLMTIEKETGRLSKLINDLMELNHLQDDFYTLNKEPIAIAQLLIDTAELFAIHVKEKNLTFHMDTDDESIMIGDAKRLQQVFYNTIDNAVKYASADSTVMISLQSKAGRIVYSIANQGTAIEKEDLDRIGERFFRTDKARNRQTGGTGLGLSIVKEIIRLHHGEFSITISDGNTTTVTIGLPAVTDEEKDGDSYEEN